MSQLILNRIRTPDGTELTSWHRHDYVTHVDKNGQTYMVDGGCAYLRRGVHEPFYEATELSQYLSKDHMHNREYFHWGSRGVNGDEPLVRYPLKNLTTEHIEAILDTQHQITGSYVEGLFVEELKFRSVS